MSRVLAPQVAIFDTGTDDGEVGLVCIACQLFEHAGLYHRVLIEGDEPLTAEFESLAAELVQGSSDAEVTLVGNHDGIGCYGADVGDII